MYIRNSASASQNHLSTYVSICEFPKRKNLRGTAWPVHAQHSMDHCANISSSTSFLPQSLVFLRPRIELNRTKITPTCPTTCRPRAIRPAHQLQSVSRPPRRSSSSCTNSDRIRRHFFLHGTESHRRAASVPVCSEGVVSVLKSCVTSICCGSLWSN